MDDGRTNTNQFVNLHLFTSLFDAAQNGRVDFLEKFLDKDTINEVGPNGRTLVEEACFGGHVSVLTYLLEAGADVLLLRGDRPLHIASERIRTDVVKFLLQHEVPVDMKDKDFRTPLHVACTIKSASRVVEILLQAGALVDEKDVNNQTPLHVACSYGIIHIVDLLLQYGSNINARDSKNQTPLDVAVARGRVFIVQFLLYRGASVNTHDIAGVTPLHRACQKENADLIELLLKFRAFVDAADHHGAVPLQVLSLKNIGNLEMLLDYGAGNLPCKKAGCRCNITVKNCLYLKYLGCSSIRKEFEKQFIKRSYCTLEDGRIQVLPHASRHMGLPELADYNKKCEAELAKMKSDYIENSIVTYFNVLQREAFAAENWQQLGWDQIDASELSTYLRLKYKIYGTMIFCSYLNLKSLGHRQ